VPKEQVQTYTVCVPHTVEKEVQVQVCKMVPKTVTCKVPVTCCRPQPCCNSCCDD